MKYKVYYVDRKGRMTDCICETLKECINVAKSFQCDVDVYEYDGQTDSYKYHCSLEVL